MPDISVYQSWKAEIEALQTLKSDLGRIEESLDEYRRDFLKKIKNLTEVDMPSEVVTAYYDRYAKVINLNIGTIILKLKLDKRKIDNAIAQIAGLLSQVPINTRGARTYAPPPQNLKPPIIDKFQNKHPIPHTDDPQLHPEKFDADNLINDIIKKMNDRER